MGQVFDLAAAGPILKQKYESKKVQTGFFDDRPFLSDVPKDETSGGAAFNFPIKFAPMSTRAMTVPNALAQGSADQYKTFNINNGLYNDFAVVQLSMSAVDNAQGDENAMIKLLEEAFDGAYDAAYESQSLQLFGNGGGQRGKLVSTQTLSSATATLTNVGDAVNFWPGQVYQASIDDGSNGASNAGVKTGALTVLAVDYQGGTVTFTQPLNVGITTIAASDRLFVFGDYGNGFVGLGGWNPTAAPTSSSAQFFGVPRYLNVVGFSGWRVTGNGQAYEDTLTDLTARMCSIGGLKTGRRCYVNPIDWAQMAKTQNSKVIYDKATVKSISTPELSFEALQMMTPKGSMDIIADVGVPQGVGRVIEPSQLTLMSNGKICRPQTNWANLMWLPSYTDETLQTRLVSRSFLKVLRPASTGVATF